MKRTTKKRPEQESAATSPGATSAPELDPMLGDKTPAFVEWLRDNDPDEFATRYSGRKTHLGYHP